MDTCIGLVGKDYVLLAADAMAGRSIMIYKSDEDKILPLNSTTLLGMTGPQGDRANFGEYVRRNVYLKELREKVPLTTSAIANFTRNELHEALRSGPYQVNILLGGVDEAKPSLYYMDYLASMQEVNFGVHGHASNFCLSVLDKYWLPNMSQEEGIECLRKCIKELNTRFMINLSEWKVKIITAEGLKEVAL